MPLLEMRDLLARTGIADIGRLNDHQVRKAARSLLRSAAGLRNLSDIRDVLAFFSRAGDLDRVGLRQLFDRAVDLLDFHVEPDKGLVYAGQYGTYLDQWKPPDDRLTEEIRAAEPLPSGAADRTTIAHTPGGRWLLPWNMTYLLGADGEDAIWAHATRRFIDALTGQVEVLLPYSEFNNILRQLPWHPLYSVPGIKLVIYYLDADSRQLMNPPKELFDAGVAKTAFGIPVLFRGTK